MYTTLDTPPGLLQLSMCMAVPCVQLHTAGVALPQHVSCCASKHEHQACKHVPRSEISHCLFHSSHGGTAVTIACPGLALQEAAWDMQHVWH
jgi:hypothetical protein